MQYNYVMNQNSDPLAPGTLPVGPGETSLAAQLPVVHTSVPQSQEKDLETQGIFRVGPHTITRDIKGQLNCPYCDYNTSVIGRLRRHVTVHTGKEYKCTLCNRSYTDEYKLKEHFKVKHEQSVRFVCDLCTREFTSKGGLRYHRRTMHHKDFDFWCEICSKGFNQFLFYKNHMNKHGKPMTLKCKSCTKQFSSLEAHSAHCKDCVSGTSNKQFACEACSATFGCGAELDTHVAVAHSGASKFRCGCGADFRWRAKYDNHRATCVHSGIENGAPDVKVDDGLANIAIVNVESLPPPREAEEKSTNVNFDENSVQITNMESGEQFIYDLTEDSEELAKSAATPSQEPGASVVLDCPHCSYRTDKPASLKRHQLTHTKKKYKCNECHKAFFELDRLRTHQNAKHKGPFGYKCDKCSRTFLSKGGIMYHQQTKHNNSYKYRCETCDKGFNTIQHYLGHKNTHSGVRPFVCEKCNLGFAYPSVLTSHKRVCKGKVDGVDMNGRLDYYPCKECKEKFAMFPALQQHVQDVHGKSGLKRYLCECGADFELHALYEHHKTSCNLSDKSVEMILQDVTGEGEDGRQNEGEGGVAEDTEFKQLSPEKFNAILSTQPVFPL